jgi:NTE family protein
MAKRKISLVLGSGGARGLAHIGAIRCIEQYGYEIASIAGSSMGALIGGIYATGKLEDFAQWVCALRRKDVVSLLDFGWGRGGALFKGEKVIEVLQDLIGETFIEELPIGFTAVATDLNRKREVWINKGPLFAGIRASIAVPMVFSGVMRGNQLLLDGAILNPLPIAPVLSNNSDLIFAVDVNGMDERNLFELTPATESAGENKTRPEQGDDEEEPVEEGSMRSAVVNFVNELLSGDDEPVTDRGMFDIALEAMDTMQVTISRLKLSVNTPDLLVEIPRDTAHFFEFERAEELINIGYARMDEALKRAGGRAE